MATTTNFGWETPDDTDLVKDGAAAIRTALGGVDTSFVDLKGGTTGQVLAKASATDLDFSWVAQDDSNAIQNALLTTTGDTIYASGASTPARLGIGSTGQVLTVAGGVPTWAAPATGGGMTLLASGTLSGTSVSLTSISQSYKNLIIYLRDYRNSGGTNSTQLQLNGNSSAANSLEQRIQTTTYQVQGTANHTISQEVSNTDADAHAYIFIPDYTSSSVALAQSYAYNKYANTTNTLLFSTTSFPSVNTAITSVQINSPSTWGGGTYELWGQK